MAEPKPRTVVCVYPGGRARMGDLELWKVNANGSRKRLEYSVQPDPVRPCVALQIH